jgi:hypothetical protein
VVACCCAVEAGTRTHVTFAGRDDALVRLGRPGIALRVDGPSAGDATILANELSRELAHQVYTRPLGADDPGDYELAVAFESPSIVGEVPELPFSAILTSSRGQRLWAIEGHSEFERAHPDSEVFVAIGRNVVSALIHDGWVQPRYDPDDPPPRSPNVRSE